MYRPWPSQFCEMPAKVTNWITDPLRWFCELLLLEGGDFDVSPYLACFITNLLIIITRDISLSIIIFETNSIHMYSSSIGSIYI